jgi:hypothetical protein
MGSSSGPSSAAPSCTQSARVPSCNTRVAISPMVTSVVCIAGREISGSADRCQNRART